MHFKEICLPEYPGLNQNFNHFFCHCYFKLALPQRSLDNEEPIIGGLIGVLILLIVICLIVFAIRRQRYSLSSNKNQFMKIKNSIKCYVVHFI